LLLRVVPVAVLAALWSAPLGVVGVIGVVLVTLGMCWLAGVLLAGRRHVVLRTRRDLAAWSAVDEACRIITKCWPSLGEMAEPKDIAPVLGRARFQLAWLLANRAQLDGHIDALRTAPYGLPADDPIRAELAGRRAELDARRAAIDAHIEARTATLRRLAARTGEHAYRQVVVDRARMAMSRAADIEWADPPVGDPADEVAARTDSVLDAYRGLVESLQSRSGP
jgi:hypothetical protein